MKALTLHEPWASLVRAGWKEVETRSWYTSYRGPLYIHAGLTTDKIERSRISFLLASRGAELPDFRVNAPAANVDADCEPDKSYIVAVCQLVACIPTPFAESSALKLRPPFTPAHGWDTERAFGNYEVGRWAWILREIRPVSPPIAARGNRKLWDFPQLAANRHFAKVSA
jgi:hypothetical protein